MPRPEQTGGGFVRAWSTTTGREQWVPAHFFDSPVTSRGLTTTDPNPPAPERAADEAPSMQWTRAELDAYAASAGIDATGEKTKADVLAAIEAAAAAPESQQHDNGTNEPPPVGENQE